MQLDALPTVLQKLFMQGLGESDVTGFYPVFMAGAGILMFVTSFFATGLALRQVIKWNAIDSIRYIETGNRTKKKQNLATRFLILEMAWRNITRSKKRLLISVGSLLIGCITALGAEVIMIGTDITNQIEQNPDFRIGILTGIFRFPEMVPDQINDDTPVLSSEMLDTIYKMEGINETTIKTAKGSYAVIDFLADKALQPRRQSLDDPEKTLAFATLQIVDKSYVTELERYVADNNLTVDMNRFASGEGCILLHHNEMSQELELRAEKTFDISFDIEESEDDAVINQKLVQLIQKENQKVGIMDTFYLEANYTLLESEQNRIDTANIILGGLSLVILVIGIMNYGNMLSAALSVRRKEIAVMQSLGLTKSQLWKMIFYEGIGYWGILILAILPTGSTVIWFLGKAIKNRLLYFKFIYPWKSLFTLSVIMLIICCLFPCTVYLKNKNLSDEIKRNDD